MTDDPAVPRSVPGAAAPRSTPPSTVDKGGEGADEDALVRVAETSTRSHLLARGFILGSVVALAAAVFVVQNRGSVGFEWLWFDFKAYLWLMLLVAFAAGLASGPLLLAGWRRSARREAQRRRVIDRYKQRRRPKQPTSTTRHA